MKISGKILLSTAAAALLLTGVATAQGIGERRGADGAHEARHEGERRGDGGRRDGQRGRQMMQQMFETFDLNGDGNLTQEEINTARGEQLSEADADGNGTLSIAEYEGLWLDAMRERMVDAFQRHDADGDGEVTAEEFNSRFAGIVERMDRNDDGALSEDDRRQRRGGADTEEE